MSLNRQTRRLHYWFSFAFAIPILVMIGSGVLLQLKKQWDWVQPSEIRGTGKEPTVDLQDIVRIIGADSALGVQGWSEIARMDIRADRGLAKVTLTSGMEAQVDLGTGRLLKTAVRRSDLIESIHDGSFFAGDVSKLGLFLPAGVVLALLWLTGLWMFFVTWRARRRRKPSTS